MRFVNLSPGYDLMENMMELNIGEKVIYPNQGVCLVEAIQNKNIGDISAKFYSLRVLNDNSTIFVPFNNVDGVGLRPVFSRRQCANLMEFLEKDFSLVSNDWKVRSREFNEKLQSGDLFETAEVLKKLTFLSLEKKLSFREQFFLDKSRFLIASEVTNSGLTKPDKIDAEINRRLADACRKHQNLQTKVSVATSH